MLAYFSLFFLILYEKPAHEEMASAVPLEGGMTCLRFIPSTLHKLHQGFKIHCKQNKTATESSGMASSEHPSEVMFSGFETS